MDKVFNYIIIDHVMRVVLHQKQSSLVGGGDTN